MPPTTTLGALDGELPCGPDLEYDQAFLDLEILTRGKSEQQFGDTVVAAEAPNWKSVLECCEGLNQRTRDLRVLTCQARALTNLHGVAGAADGYTLIRGAVSELWDDLHPKLDDDDDNDPTMRLNALAAITDNIDGDQPLKSGVKELKDAQWITAKGVACTVRQALAGLNPNESETGQTPFSLSALQEMVAEAAKSDATNHARRALVELAEIGKLLDDRVGAQYSPEFKSLKGLLKPLAELFDRTTGSAVSESTRQFDSSSVSASRLNGGAGDGTIRSRNDATQMLERVSAFLEQNEPSNPAPLLIRRAQRLINMSFIDIVKDMAPDALTNVENIAGTNRTNPTE